MQIFQISVGSPNFSPAAHTGENPSLIQISLISRIYLTTKHLNTISNKKFQKNPENPENIESGSKIRIRIPENFGPQIFFKFDFKGGLWSKICHKNDFLLVK